MDYKERRAIRDALKARTKHLDIEGLAQEYGTPLLIFDPQKMKDQYQRLQQALPNVRLYFALKAAGHLDAVKVIKSCNGYLDIATAGEIKLVQKAGFPIDHCMHTHPVKKPQEIDEAYQAGLRRFVVENQSELEKFAALPKDIEIMIRLSFPNPEAGSNLSYKFGATEADAKKLVRRAQKQGTTVAGFCLHVGSQIHSGDAFVVAIRKTLQIMKDLEKKLGARFSVLNIGGGFPVQYREPVPSLDEITDKIRPLIEPLMDKLTILAEPGRFIAAPSAILLTSVVGTSRRYGKPWYYIDDGLYGAYSIFIYDHMQPHIFANKELAADTPRDQLQQSVLAGPSCDSFDVVAQDYPLPKLNIGDLLVSPMMGAYSTVSATNFNGIPTPKIIAIPQD